MDKKKAIPPALIAAAVAFALTAPATFGTGEISMKCGGSGEGNYEEKCIDAETGRPTEGMNGVQLKGGDRVISPEQMTDGM